MKKLHYYEDGMLKVVYDNGTMGLLFDGVRDIEVKFLVKANGKIFSIPINGGMPSEIKDEKETRWMQISGSSVGELVYKSIINFGVTVAWSMGDRVFRSIYQCLKSARPSICGE